MAKLQLNFSEMRAKIALVLFLSGIICPFLWPFALFLRSDPDRTVHFFYSLSMWGITIEITLLMVAIWVFLLVFWNLPALYTPYMNTIGQWLYPGDLLGMFFFVVMIAILLVDVLSTTIICKKKSPIKQEPPQ